MANQYAVTGKSSEATIDQVNIWMRSTPWYQAQLKAWGQDPGHPTLTKAQSQQLLAMAQTQGVQVDTGDVEIDNHGNLNPKGHKLRNTLLVAGIAGATIATMGAAGVFSAAGAAPAAAGTTAAGTTGATLAGVEGLPWGLTDTALAGLGVKKVGDVATRGVSSWLTPLLGTALPVAGSLVGAGMQNAAYNDAAAIQAKSVAEALAYEKEKDAYDRARQAGLDTYAQGQDARAEAWKANQYADLTARLDPYLQAGASSNDRMAALLGLPARPPTAVPAPASRVAMPPPAVPPPVVPPPSSPAPTATTAPPARPVLMQAPDGTQKQVPASEVDHWKSVGAVVVGEAA